MKVAIFAILFFFCAAAKATSDADFHDYVQDLYDLEEESTDIVPMPRAKIAENLKNAANQFVRKSIAEFHKVEETFKKVAERIRDKAKVIADKTEKKVQQSVTVVENKVKDLINKGKIFFNCIKQNFPNFKELEKTTVKNLAECGKNLIHSISDFEKSASGYATDLVKALAKLSAMVAECVSDNPLASAKCALGQIDAAKIAVTNIINDFKNLINVYREKSGPIVNDVHDCKENNFTAIAEKAHEVSEKMHQCTKNY